MDRVKRISKIDEEDIVQDEELEETVKTDALVEDIPEASLTSSTESIVECLENVSKILSEVNNLDENGKVRTDKNSKNDTWRFRGD